MAMTGRHRLPGRGERLLHVFGLGGVAVAQPLFDVLLANPPFLTAHGVGRLDLLGLVTALLLLTPACYAPLDLLFGRRNGRPARLLYAFAITLLTTAIFLQLGRRLAALPAWVLLFAALAGSGLVVWLALRHAGMRFFLGLLAPGALLLALLFLTRSAGLGLREAEARPSAATEAAEGPSLVLVILDELPLSSLLDADGQINAYRYPHFAALAAAGLWFRDATTVARDTHYAVPAIFSGQRPARRRLPTVADYPHNLCSWLAGAYTLHVYEALTELCPPPPGGDDGQRGALGRLGWTLLDLSAVYLHLTLPPTLAAELPEVRGGWRDYWATALAAGQRVEEQGGPPEIWSRFTAAVAAHRGEAAVYGVHVLLPHLPWRYLPSGQHYGPRGLSPAPHRLIASEHWGDDPWATVQAYQRHLLQVAYADRLLGQLMDSMRRAGLWERAVLVVTADHGISFQPGTPYRSATEEAATEETRSDILRVPLFIRVPGRMAPAVREGNVELIDILPTIAAALDRPLPWAVDGRAVLAAGFTPRPEKIFFAGQDGDHPQRLALAAAALAGPEETVKRQLALFGSGEDGESIYRIGPFRALIGQQVAAVPLGTPPTARLQIRDAEQWQDVQPQGDFLPVHLIANLYPSPDGSLPRQLAVALNGTIQAVTTSYRDPRGIGWMTAMLPPSALRAGANAVEVYAISGPEDAPHLAPVSAAQPRYNPPLED